MDKMAAMRDRLATPGARRSMIDHRRATLSLPSLMKNGRLCRNRIAALRHFQPLYLFNFGVL
jgi:hypothetical protein